MPLEDLRQDRLKKLKRLEKEGINPYPAEVTRTHSVREVRASFDALSSAGTEVELAGRVMGFRDQGGVVFLDLREENATIQVVLKKDSLDTFALFAEVLDIGDFISVGGILFKTSKGEESIEARKLTMLAKSIRPLPGEWHGLRDVETRLRKRYLELILSPETRELFEKKAVFWKTCRDFLTREGFIEVETPTLQEIAGGADAEPFVTYHQTLGTDFYLRIALELPLKKLLIGGYDKVFELGRIFRNEGISREHLQDYTQLEFYWAYHDYRDLMKFVEKLYQEVVQAVTGGLTTTWQGKTIDWGGEWPVLEYVELFEKEAGFNPLALNRDELFKKAVSMGFEPEENLGKGRLIDHIYKRTVRPKFVEPAFLVNPPVELVPLAKRMPEDPLRAARMQPVACGTELGNGFSELNDPLDQRARFEEQMKLRERGDREAQLLDEEYLEAMEYGMPPAAGFGVSERFFAVLMDKPVRETVLFPLMRPEKPRTLSDGQSQKTRVQDFSKKLSIVVRDDLEAWQVMNAIAHASAYLGNKMQPPFDTGECFETKDGACYPRNTQYPIIVLKSAASEMGELVENVRASGLPHLAFVREMLETVNDEKIEKIVGGKKDEEMEVLGVGVFGAVDEVDALTKKFSLWK